jgi:hypothetical protein
MKGIGRPLVICLGGLTKTTINVYKHSRLPDPHLNAGPPECEARVITMWDFRFSRRRAGRWQPKADRRFRCAHLKRRSTFMRLHGATPQKTVIFKSANYPTATLVPFGATGSQPEQVRGPLWYFVTWWGLLAPRRTSKLEVFSNCLFIIYVATLQMEYWTKKNVRQHVAGALSEAKAVPLHATKALGGREV